MSSFPVMKPVRVQCPKCQKWGDGIANGCAVMFQCEERVEGRDGQVRRCGGWT